MAVLPPHFRISIFAGPHNNEMKLTKGNKVHAARHSASPGGLHAAPRAHH
jgi:hypothetical protein